ncbi:MAG: hypothetical protein K2N73_10990 [Lachnospiraceae bacterium]|nr:hypothetical protein [Lachnospiraceae bacterium]
MGIVHTKVAVVLRFIDAVTRRWVTKTDGKAGITVKVRQQNKVLWKGADCAVILAQPGECSMDIMVSGGVYVDRQLYICLPEDNKPVIRYLWMQPAAGYPFSADMTVIRGRCAGGKAAGALYAVWITDNTKYKLMETTAPGDEVIRLWGIDGIAEERIVLLCENGESEYVTLLGQTDTSEYSYRVKGGMKKAFRKESAKIYMAAKLIPDSSGSFIIAYQHWEERCEKIRFWRDGVTVAELKIGRNKEYCVLTGGQQTDEY